MSTDYAVWQELGPGSGYAFAESQRGLSDEQVTAIYFGQPLPEPLPEVEITHLDEGQLGNLVGSSFSVLIVSPAVQELLDTAAPGKLQFVPVELPHSTGTGYAILNVLAHVPCFDFDRSDYDRLPGHADRLIAVRRLVLREIPDDAPAIFHVAELPAAILVRKDLREKLETLDDGIGEFISVDDFTWGVP